MTTPEEELAQILGGGGGQSPQDELAGILGGGKDAFKPWSGPQQVPLQQSSSVGQALWGTQNDPNADPLDQLAEGASDFGQRAAMSATMGYGDEILGALGADQGAIRDRVQLAKERSPGWALGGDIAGGIAPALATGNVAAPAMSALPLAGKVAAGMGFGAEQAGLAASGYADGGNRWQAATDAAPMGAALGGAGELAASGASGALQWGRDTAAPWLKQSGLIDRVASSGRSGAGMEELGGRQNIVDLGQWMENNGVTGLTPGRVAKQVTPIVDNLTGQQGDFLDQLATMDSPPTVNTEAIAGQLGDYASQQARLTPPANQTQAAGARNAAQSLLDASQPLTDVSPGANSPMAGRSMDFGNALDQRQAWDKQAHWAKLNQDTPSEAVAKETANALRGGLVDSLQQQAPDLAPQWQNIQGNLSNALDVQAPSVRRDLRSAGEAALPFSGVGGTARTLGALAIRTGGRGIAADAQRGGSAALDWLGTQGDNVAGFTEGASQMGAQQYGANDGVKQSRGYLLPQAAQQMMQQPGSLGPYEKQFFDAANSQDQNALSSLITKLSHTDQRFQPYLQKLQQLTAEGGF